MNVSSVINWFRDLKIDSLEGIIPVIDDSHAATKLKNKRGVQLVIAYPSFSMRATVDDNTTIQSLYLFVISQLSDKERNDNRELEQMEASLAIAEEIVQRIKESASAGESYFCRLSGDIDLSPEYNAFGGWDGWSFVFEA